jgi:aminoglycoside phosphotransferase (APT) family kinase protein
MEDSARELETWLHQEGLLAPGPALLEPLGGGVSCEIYRVRQGNVKFVVKRALARLRVKAEWLADVSRNAVEHAFYETMAGPLEGSVPRVFHHSPDRGYFTMEYLEDGWRNWKDLLLEGQIEPEHGHMAGSLMGRLHRVSWDHDEWRARFDTTANFRQLRTDPYYRTLIGQHPDHRAFLEAEIERLENTRLCLVHGDFSPKNILIHGHRMMLLDAEVAWYGDPAFDAAFLHTHLFLKGLLHAGRGSLWAETSSSAWEAYAGEMGSHCDTGLDRRTAVLTAMMMLARIDGKSPVEYLTPGRRELTRDFCLRTLGQRIENLGRLRASWRDALQSI